MLGDMKSTWQSLSVFFPVFNEAEALPGVIDDSLAALKRLGVPKYEVVIVDDGSVDGTAEIADGIADQNPLVRVVHHAQNEGYGAALGSGFAAARYEWVVYNDGDGQFHLGNLERFVSASERADVVLGYRRHRHDHAGRKFNAWLWSVLVWIILGLKVRDLDCGFKLLRTSRVRELGTLEARGAVISAELLMKLRAAGCKWEEVPVEHYARVGGAPTGARLSVILRAVRELVRLRFKLAGRGLV